VELSSLFFMTEFVRVCLVLKIALMIYGFPIPLNIFGTPFSYRLGHCGGANPLPPQENKSSPKA
jgi:hypothetical protein